MIRFSLFRHGSIPDIGTIGDIHVAGKSFPVIEREWKNNERFVSCIPTGRYRVVPYSSEKYPKSWALVNTDLGIYLHKSDIPKGAGRTRYAIIIHSANLPSQLAGCIAPGTERGYPSIDGKTGLGVFQSRIAIKSLYNVFADQKEAIYLDIDQVPINW